MHESVVKFESVESFESKPVNHLAKTEGRRDYEKKIEAPEKIILHLF